MNFEKIFTNNNYFDPNGVALTDKNPWSIHKIEDKYFLELEDATVGPLSYDELISIYRDESNIDKLFSMGKTVFLNEQLNSEKTQHEETRHNVVTRTLVKRVSIKSENEEEQDEEQMREYMPIVGTANIGFREFKEDQMFCYTTFANAEDEEGWNRLMNLLKRLSTGYKNKFNCTVTVDFKQVVYRGNICFSVIIVGSSKSGIIKCRNSLPKFLRDKLILNVENSTEISNIVNEVTDHF